MNEEIVGAIQSRCELVFKLAQLDFKSKLILSLVKVKRIITGSSNSPMENVQCATTVHLAPTNFFLPKCSVSSQCLNEASNRHKSCMGQDAIGGEKKSEAVGKRGMYEMNERN